MCHNPNEIIDFQDACLETPDLWEFENKEEETAFLEAQFIYDCEHH